MQPSHQAIETIDRSSQQTTNNDIVNADPRTEYPRAKNQAMVRHKTAKENQPVSDGDKNGGNINVNGMRTQVIDEEIKKSGIDKTGIPANTQSLRRKKPYKERKQGSSQKHQMMLTEISETSVAGHRDTCHRSARFIQAGKRTTATSKEVPHQGSSRKDALDTPTEQRDKKLDSSSESSYPEVFLTPLYEIVADQLLDHSNEPRPHNNEL